MCCRYYCSVIENDYIRETATEVSEDTLFRTGDIHPSDKATILTGRKPGIYAEDMQWGFPSYQSNGLLINARAETVCTKKTFSESMRWRRCVIAAHFFYEWNRDKQPVTFTVPDREIILLAGIWSPFLDGNRFTILTTEANSSMRPVHDRMPLIIEENRILDWVYDETAAKKMLTLIPPVLHRQQDYEQLTIPLF